MKRLQLNQSDLTQILIPGQEIQLIMEQLGPTGDPEEISGPVKVLKYNGVSLVLRIEKDLLDHFIQFQPGRFVKLLIGHPSGLATFKSKIIHRHISQVLELTVDSPQFVTKWERRHEERFSLQVPLSYRILGLGGLALPQLANKFGDGETVNLSKGGLYFLTDLKLLSGLMVEIQFNAKGANYLINGLVRRTQTSKNKRYPYLSAVQYQTAYPELTRLFNSLK